MSAENPITQALHDKIRANLHPIVLKIVNESAKHSGHHAVRQGLPGKAATTGETHFNVLIVSEVFVGLSRIDRHRRVYDLFAEERDQGLHALSLRTLTPEEYSE